jgi:hypothetical protein
MAQPQPIVVLEPLPWTQSMVMSFALNELVNGGLLAPNVEGVPRRGSSRRRQTGSPTYVVSFIRLHERGFNVPASHFMRGLCYHLRTRSVPVVDG